MTTAASSKGSDRNEGGVTILWTVSVGQTRRIPEGQV